jgi:hypothetical protein
VSWWNPFSWGPGGPGDGEPDRQEGIWGGVGGSGFHAGSMLGEGSTLGAGEAGMGETTPTVPSDLTLSYGTIGGGIVASGADVLGEARVTGSGLAEGSVTFAVPTGPPVETSVGEEARAGEADWSTDLIRRDQ